MIVPPSPGAFSAFGALCSALAKDRSETVLALLDDSALAAARPRVEAMVESLMAEFAEEGAAVDRLSLEQHYELRYRGQAHELSITAPSDANASVIASLFEASFERQFGRRDSGRGIEMVNVRVVGRIPIQVPGWSKPRDGKDAAPQERPVVVDGARVTCPVWDRVALSAGARSPGRPSSRRCRRPPICRPGGG